MNIEGCCVVFNNERIVPYIENHSKKDVIVNPRVDQNTCFFLKLSVWDLNSLKKTKKWTILKIKF